MKTYVFGHKKPDTDTVCSSIAYAYLKQCLGMDVEPRVLGDINKETKFALSSFNVEEPKYLNDVRIRIKDMKYLKNAYLNEHMSLEDSFNLMHEMNVTGLPMIDDESNLKGYINLKDICKYMIEGDLYSLETNYNNLLKVIGGKGILQFDNEIRGNLIAAAYRSTTFMDEIKLTNNDILIVGDRTKIMEYAIDCHVKMLIITGNFNIPAELLAKANTNKVNVIVSKEPTYVVSTKARLANFVYLACNQVNPVTFRESDYRDDFITIAEQSNHTNYPVIHNDKCVGMIRLVDQNSYDKHQCILVDHNFNEQSADGIDQANILEVVDHHNIGLFKSSLPISFRVMPVGCTSTIIYQIYQENKVEIPKNIAGIMLSAILSDTLIFKSPTTTELDIVTAKRLAQIAEVNIDEYGINMFKAGTSIDDMSIEEIFQQDFKSFKADANSIGISQVMTLNIDSILDNKNDYIKHLNNLATTMEYKVVLMFVTDIIKNGSYIFFNENAKDIVSSAYHLKDLEQGLFLDGVVSRKKQMLPKLLDYLTK